MSVETKNDTRFLKNYMFLNNYHNNSLKDPGGTKEKPITMFLSMPVVDDKYYILPTFLNKTKEIVSEDEAGRYFREEIEQGLVKGYDTKEEAIEAHKKLYKTITGIDIEVNIK